MESTLQYLKGLQSRLQSGGQAELQGEDADELGLLVQNAFQEIDGSEFRLACHHDGSVYLEQLLNLASSFQVRVFWDRLAGCYGRVMCHRYASHVLETLLVRSECLANSNPSPQLDTSEESGVLPSLGELLSRFEEDAVEGLGDSMANPYASHVLRVYVDKFDPSGSFCDALLSEWQAHWKSPTGAPVLQALLLKKPALVEGLPLTKKTFMALATDKIGSRCCEAFLEAAAKVSRECFTTTYQHLIRGDTHALAADRHANFVVQALISQCPTESLLSVVLDELSGHFDVKERMGIVFKVLEWPVRRGRAFDKATAFFFASLHLKTPSERQSAVGLLKDSKIGLSILALFPKYPAEYCKHIVDGFLDLDPEQLARLATDRTAAHTVEAFISPANTIGAKARVRIVRKLAPLAAALAVDPAGSFVIETAFAAAPIDLKMAIAANLASSRKRLEDSKSGKIILKKCAIEDFERRQEEWKKARMSADTKRFLLDDIIGDNNDDGMRHRSKKAKGYH